MASSNQATHQASDPKASAPGRRRDLRRALGYLRPYWGWQAAALLVALITTGLALVFPWINKLLIDEVILERDLTMLRTVCLALFVVVLAQGVLGVVQRWLFQHVGERAVVDLRRQLVDRYFHKPLGFFQKERVGKILSVFTSDVPAMQQLYTSTLVDFVTDSLRLLVTVGVLAAIDWRLTLVLLPIFPLFAFCLKRFSRPVRGLSRQVQEANAGLSSQLQETFSGLREIKAYRQQLFTRGRLGKHFDGIFRLRVRQRLVESANSGAAETVAMTGVVLALFLGGLKAIRGDLTMGLLIAYVNYLGALFSPVARFTELNNRVQAALGSAERVFDTLDDDPEPLPRGRRRPERITGAVVVDDLSFAYVPGQDVLHGVDLTIEPGETIALVGPSGSGKSTLVSLLMGFHRGYRGSLSLDGVEIREMDPDFLRRHLGVVFQESFLFDDTVAENIRFGRRRASRREIEAAAAVAQADDFIRALPQGYDTPVGERGARLSGGQRQRIALARAVLLDPEILLLDEATAALDSESEQRVVEALNRLMEGRTTLVIAHRLSTVERADRIVVMEGGRITECGPHRQLLARHGTYRRLWDLQLLEPRTAEGHEEPVLEAVAGG